MGEVKLERKRPLLSARQLAVAAVFGGIAFAFEALKIVLPGYMPGVNYDFTGTWLTLATMIGGPWVGVLVAVIDSIAGEVGLIGVPGFAIHVLIFALLYPKVYAISAKGIRVAAFWAISFLSLITQVWYWIFLYAYVLKLMPVGAQIVFQVSGPLWVYTVIYCLVPSIVLSMAPRFVEPDWGWGRAGHRHPADMPEPATRLGVIAPSVPGPHSREELSATRTLLRYERVSFQYKHGNSAALISLSLSVKEGEVVLLTGPSGAGKTTVCRAANGLIPNLYPGQLQNHVVVDERYVTTAYDVASLGRIVGLLFQDPNYQLLMPTVEDELAFGACNYGVPREEIRRRVAALLSLVRLSAMRTKNPHNLSGGQKQAVALSAVLITDPLVLVLDEPTSNLDPLGSQQIMQLVSRLAKEERRTVLVVEHKIEELVHLSDRLVVMDEGRVIRSGSPRTVLEDVEMLHRMGVHTPEVTLLCQRLRAFGAPVTHLPLTVEDARTALAPLLRPKAEWVGRVSPPDDRPLCGTLGEPIVQIERLVHRYPDGTAALAGVDLTVRKGEMLSVLGHSGSGKTTLIKHLNGLLRPTSGRVLVAGMDTREHHVAELSQVVGYVFQDPNAQIFKMKVWDEIAFGPRNQKLKAADVAERVEEAADQLSIKHLLDQNPFFLSLGEKQRVAVAAVMAMRPQVLLLDEPTTGQDLRKSRQIMDLCVTMNQRRTTIIMITHDMLVAARYAKRVVVMKDGMVLADGPVRDIFSQVEMLERSFLMPPQTTRLGKALELPFTLLTVEEAETTVKALLREVI
jgi:energy-coupling factor transport system ATP-binding protein